MIRILVTGSRDWSDRAAIQRKLNALCEVFDLNYPPDEYGNTSADPKRVTVLHGACPSGADSIADDWCLSNDFLAERHPADWDAHGRAAGQIRNRKMVDHGAHICVAFIKNHSKGATSTANLAELAGIPVIRVTA